MSAESALPKPAGDLKSLLSPTERLNESRIGLREAMRQIAHPTPKPPGRAGSWVDQARAAVGRLTGLPGASLAAAAFERWWRKHPLHDAALLAAEATRAAIVPVARRDPMKLVFGSLLIGVALVAVRPWRLLFRLSLLKALLPHLAAVAIRQLPMASLGVLSSRAAKGSADLRE